MTECIQFDYCHLALFGTLFLSLFFNIRWKMALHNRAKGDMQLIKGAYFNPITELPNRQNIEIVAAEQIERSKRHDQSFVIGVVIVKNYNKLFIREVSNIILDALRDEDVLAHIEDGTFLILFNEYLHERDFSLILQRILMKFQQKITNTVGDSMSVEVAVGHSIYKKDASTLDDLIQIAKSEATK